MQEEKEETPPTHYYAVAKGKETGIFTDWSKVRKSVNRYPGAIYKTFETRAEAEAFLQPPCDEKTRHTIVPLLDKDIIYISGFIDNDSYGYGYIRIATDGNVDSVCGKVPDAKCNLQVAELYALYQALSRTGQDVLLCTNSNTLKKILESLDEWAEAEWKNVSNKELLKKIYALSQKRKISLCPITTLVHIQHQKRADILSEQGSHSH